MTRVLAYATETVRAGLRVIPLPNTRHTCSPLLVALKAHPKVALGKLSTAMGGGSRAG